jgi:hypothetical protein
MSDNCWIKTAKYTILENTFSLHITIEKWADTTLFGIFDGIL